MKNVTDFFFFFFFKVSSIAFSIYHALHKLDFQGEVCFEDINHNWCVAQTQTTYGTHCRSHDHEFSIVLHRFVDFILIGK